MIKRSWCKRRNCLQRCFLSFKYLIDHANICGFFLISLWTCSHSLNNINSLFKRVIPSLLFAAYFQLGLLCSSSHKFLTMHIFLLEHLKFKNYLQRRVFCNVNLSNLESLQRNLRTNRAREWIFTVPGDTNFFKNFHMALNMVAPLWVWCMYQYVINFGYTTVNV